VSGQFHAPTALPSSKVPRNPLDRRLGGPESRSGLCGAQNNLFLLPGIEPLPSSPTLYRLRWTGGIDENYESLLTVAASLPAFQQCSARSKPSLDSLGASLTNNTVVGEAEDWVQLMWKAANGDDPVPALSTSERHNVSSYDMF
jgi:hypothetical protein